MLAIIPAAIIPLFVLFKATYLYISSELAQHRIALEQVQYFYRNIKEVKTIFINGFNSTNGLLFLIFSYVVGHIFYRQDIKEPDLRSFEKTSERYKNIGPVSMDMYKKFKRITEFDCKKYLKLCYIQYFLRKRDLIKRIKRNRKETINIYREHVKFPYGRLKEYMKNRGLDHLASIILWDDEKENDNYRYKSKHFISILKIRLEFTFPRQYVKIQKNEAHVRLMSSTWYVLATITYISLTAFDVSVFTYICADFYLKFLIEEDVVRLLYFFYFMFPTVAVFLVSYHLMFKIENFLHHQRMREIIFILEMAYFANKLRPDLNILEFNY